MREKLAALAAAVDARREYREAAKALVEAMEDAIPVGTYVEIPRGNGYVRGYVIGHGCWWSEPTDLHVKLCSNGNHMCVNVGHLFPELSEAGSHE